MSCHTKPASDQAINLEDFPKERIKASEDVSPVAAAVRPIRVLPPALDRPPAPAPHPPRKATWDIFNPATEDFVLLDPATPCF
ncbi:unnamed protein product [Ascophyllum nodosum]